MADQRIGETLTTITREIEELRLLLRQAEGEVDRLTQRVGQFADQVRAIETNPDAYPRPTIQQTLTAAAAEQVRLAVMEGHRDQIRAKIGLLERFQRLLADLAQPSPPVELTPDRQDILAKVVQAQEDERHRLARQIHDGPAQSLANVVLRAEICRRLIDVDPDRARQELDDLKRFVNATLQATRRFIFDLRPMILDDLGLLPTLRRYIQAYGEKRNVPIELTVLSQDRRWPLYVEVALFRIVQEAIENAATHSGATRIQVTLDLRHDQATATVEDNGRGFVVEQALRQARARQTLGIASMLERAELLGGHLAIESSLGHGTRIRIQVTDRPASS